MAVGVFRNTVSHKVCNLSTIAANRSWPLACERETELNRSKIKPLSWTKLCLAHCIQHLLISLICDLNLYTPVKENHWNPLFHVKMCLLGHRFLSQGINISLTSLRGRRMKFPVTCLASATSAILSSADT